MPRARVRSIPAILPPSAIFVIDQDAFSGRHDLVVSTLCRRGYFCFRPVVKLSSFPIAWFVETVQLWPMASKLG